MSDKHSPDFATGTKVISYEDAPVGSSPSGFSPLSGARDPDLSCSSRQDTSPDENAAKAWIFEGLEISVTLDSDHPLVDVVLMRCGEELKGAIEHAAQKLWPRLRVISVYWSGVDNELWSHWMPLVSVTRHLTSVMRNQVQFGARRVILVGEGTLSEWIVKQYAVLSKLGSSPINVAGVIFPAMMSTPNSISELVLNIAELLGDEDHKGNGTSSSAPPSSPRESVVSVPTETGSTEDDSDTGSTASPTLGKMVAGPDRPAVEVLSPKDALKQMFGADASRDQLLQNISFVLALDKTFANLKVPFAVPSKAPEFLQQQVHLIKSLEPTLGEFRASHYYFKFEDQLLRLFKVVSTMGHSELAEIPMNFIGLALKKALTLLMKWNEIDSRKTLATMLRDEKLKITLAGPKRDAQVAEMLLYYILGFDVEKDRTTPSIELDTEQTQVSAFDQHIVVRHFKSLDDVQALIFRLKRVLMLGASGSSGTLGNSKTIFIDNVPGAEEDSAEAAPLDILLDTSPVTFKLAFFGAPSVGKSTMINCLLGQSVVYTSIKESTGCPTEILFRPSDGSVPDGSIAQVVFIDENELDQMLTPIDRTIENATSEVAFLNTTSLEELNMDENERKGRISKLKSMKAMFQSRREQYETLMKKYKSSKKLFVYSKEELQQYIKIDENKANASLADLVKRVRLFISDVPLLKHVTIVDTPGWNADSKAFGEDFRLRRSQTEVSDVDAWVYLTSAYEFDSLHENIRMIKGLTQDNAPGLIAITCFDVAKDQRDRGLQYCIGQKAAAVGMIFEGTSAVAQKKESIPLSCSKLYSDYISLTQLKSEIPKAVAKGDTAKANQLKAQVRKRWSAFLDYLNNTLDFILKEESNKDDDDECTVADDDDFDDDLLNMTTSPSKPTTARRIEHYIKFTQRTLSSPQPTRDGTVSSQDPVADVTLEISGLPQLLSRLGQQLAPRVKRTIARKYTRLDQALRGILVQSLRDIVKIKQDINFSEIKNQLLARTTVERDEKQGRITMIEKNLDNFKAKVARARKQLAEHLDLVLSMILDTTQFSSILDGRRKRDKRKGLDLFFIRREFVSLRDSFDVPARGAIHSTVATVMKHLVTQHQKLFGASEAEIASAVDYGKIDDMEYWLEEAQCITNGEHSVELRGYDKDHKAVSDWEKRSIKSCEKQKSLFSHYALLHFDKWTTKLVAEQTTICDDAIKRLHKKLKRDDKELKRIQNADKRPDRVAEMQKRLEKKRLKTDKLFNVYLSEVFEHCLRNYA